MRALPLTGAHDRTGFDFGRHELNAWLQQVAHQHQDKGISRTFVAVLDNAPAAICGYYALPLSELETRTLQAAWRKKLPRRVPGIRLGRLAIDNCYQKKGLGELLLVDAIKRAKRIHSEADGIGVFADAIDDDAAGYYRRFGFVAMPDQALLLFLPATSI